jgi:hypothetical protein
MRNPPAHRGLFQVQWVRIEPSKEAAMRRHVRKRSTWEFIVDTASTRSPAARARRARAASPRSRMRRALPASSSGTSTEEATRALSGSPSLRIGSAGSSTNGLGGFAPARWTRTRATSAGRSFRP